MDSVAGRPADLRSDRADSDNLLAVKEAYEALEAGGVEAGIERLLSRAGPDFECRPYLAAGRVLRGADEVREFFREQLAAGTALTIRPASFVESGEEVVVHGSLRVVRPTGGFSESQIRWTYRFRDGRLERMGWSPRNGG